MKNIQHHDLKRLYSYSQSVGYWVQTKNGIPLMEDPFARFRPTSKKADVETGEDKKGE